jgi:GT2 family glycosyltransferase
MTAIDVSIVVSNRNGRAFLADCLESLQGSGVPSHSHEIIVADNASSDGSVEMVRTQFPWVRVVAHERDIGFTRSNNIAIREARGRYVHLLNNDTLVLPGTIDRLIDFMDHRPDAAGVGNRLFYPDGREQFSGRRFPGLRNAFFGRRSLLSRWFPRSRWYRSYVFADELESDQPFEVDWISHAAALYRRDALLEVGGLAEDMYYWHESELALRLKRAGHCIFLHPRAALIHYEGHGDGGRSRASWRQHHRDFARGSYRFHCGRRRLGTLDPRRALTWLGLQGRACAMMALDLLRHAERRGVDADRMIHSAYDKLVHRLLQDEEDKCTTLLFTAASEGEGVSSVVATLGQELSRRCDGEVLLVDASGTRPGLERMFLRNAEAGLAELLTDRRADPENLTLELGPGLTLLPHGGGDCDFSAPDVRESFRALMPGLSRPRRFVLFDAAALEQRADALALAQLVDAVVLVVHAERTGRDAVARAARELEQAGGRLIGAIYNAKSFHVPESIYRRL